MGVLIWIRAPSALGSTCNGIERWPHWHGKPAPIPNPDAPNLIALDKRTGRLLAGDDTPISKALLHGQWSPPSLGEVDGKTLIFYGGGDGYCYAFEHVAGRPIRLKFYSKNVKLFAFQFAG